MQSKMIFKNHIDRLSTDVRLNNNYDMVCRMVTGHLATREFRTNQLATKIFILSINTEVDNKRATLNAHVFFPRIAFKITQVALLFYDCLIIFVQ